MMLSLIDAGSSPYSIRYGDGCGYYRDDGERLAPNVAFVFRDDAEIWVIDTWYLRARPALIILEAHRWAKTLQQVAEFLTTDLNIPGPYHWIAGYEGVAGRKLNISDQMGRTWGPCADNIIEKDGKFSFGKNAEEVLQKFFREIYEQCGAPVSQPRV